MTCSWFPGLSLVVEIFSDVRRMLTIRIFLFHFLFCNQGKITVFILHHLFQLEYRLHECTVNGKIGRKVLVL